MWLAIIGSFGAFVALSYLTDPFNPLSIVKLPFTIRLLRTTHTTIDRNHLLKVRQNPLHRAFALGKSGWHILHTRYLSSPAARGETVDQIIAQIHKLRFDPQKLLVISGDHFNGLFVRNLGVFYYPLLDGSFGFGADDWRRRQESYLQTVAYALGVYAKNPTPSTTIVPTGRMSATCINFYAYPSDTVYGMLYALAVLWGKQSARPYDRDFKPKNRLQTKLAARLLLQKYQQTLTCLYINYFEKVYDSSTGLIKTSVHLSGAKDITRRRSAFYDNVILWKTTQLAQTLSLIPRDDDVLASLKARIIDAFWDEQLGYFIEDLSPEAQEHKYYSSDWLVVLFTGFLDVANESERHYYERSIEYIQRMGIDEPFGLKYHHDRRASRQFLAVRLAVASYGGDSIWSFWGMEYIKALMLLYQATDNREYLDTADAQITAYEHNILKFHGFPEVYDRHGNMLKTPLYLSIRQTGWVVGFEQVKLMRNSIT